MLPIIQLESFIACRCIAKPRTPSWLDWLAAFELDDDVNEFVRFWFRYQWLVWVWLPVSWAINFNFFWEKVLVYTPFFSLLAVLILVYGPNWMDYNDHTAYAHFQTWLNIRAGLL